MIPSRSITSTYRLQVHGDPPPGTGDDRAALTFAEVTELAEHLIELGAGHVYLSPILEAFPGSLHNYDVVDPTRTADALGGAEGLRVLADRLRALSSGLVVDIVPNHVGVESAAANGWFWDVLRHGRGSRYAAVFDFDWEIGRIALPVLGSPEDLSELRLVGEGDARELHYYEHRFPVAAGSAGATPQEVHDQQHYELVSWRSGRVGYRRFFHVNTLAALRQQDPAVFDLTHTEIRRWMREDLVDGLRVDHPDGLADPADYLRRLRALIGPERWLVVEKILASDEALDPTLPVDGTTGYDALRELGGVLIDPAGEAPLGDLAEELTGVRGEHADLAEGEHQLKRDAIVVGLRPEAQRCARVVLAAAPDAPVSVGQLTEAVAELVAVLPVYRADYRTTALLLPPALAAALGRRPDLSAALDLLGAAVAAGGEAAQRFQQVAGAATAKGVEDRLFYRLARLVSLQEVGGDPAWFAVSPGEFHLAAAERARSWPAAMTTLSTHDTKRGEDVRARIHVISELPQQWAETVAAAATHAPPPDGLMGAFLWQNLLGVWPTDGSRPDDVLRSRIHAYAEKAVREAGTRTEWNSVDDAFESALHAWLDTVMEGPAGDELARFVEIAAPAGWSNSLTQKLLHLAGPGIPDVYQGTELWEDSLVDPDNRREVDHDLRRELLAELDAPGAKVPAVDASGRAKLLVVSRALRLRRERAASFVGGRYAGLQAAGPAAEHAIGFWRGPADNDDVLAVGTRLSVGLQRRGGWAETTLTLPAGTWIDRLTGREHTGDTALADLLSNLPVALLSRERS